MGRVPRLRIGEEEGSYHVISRILGKKGEDFLINEEGKNYLLCLLKLCCSAYFVELHSFCILDNHFHLLVSEKQSAAEVATAEQLMERYRILKQREFHHQLSNDEGAAKLQIEALRSRFSDVSRFVQELKQSFGRWYNKKHERRGTLWTDRFKSILVSCGKAQVDVSAYIELNPVRAGIVSRPEDYKWCGLGQVHRGESDQFMSFVDTVEHEGDLRFDDYRDYVYDVGGLSMVSEEADFSDNSESQSEECERQSACYSARVSSFSMGVVLGTQAFVEKVQGFLGRKFIRGRKLLRHREIYGTRVLISSGV